jgi:hypothetical protein
MNKHPEPIKTTWSPTPDPTGVGGSPVGPSRLDVVTTWKNKRRDVTIGFDLFEPSIPFTHIDRVIARVASRGLHLFRVRTAHPARVEEYLQRVAAGGPAASVAYQRRILAHWDSWKEKCSYWHHTLPEPPTPEVRFIYDQAGALEPEPTRPYQERSIPQGEFHWRKWPLDNLVFETPTGEPLAITYPPPCESPYLTLVKVADAERALADALEARRQSQSSSKAGVIAALIEAEALLKSAGLTSLATVMLAMAEGAKEGGR